MTEFLSCSVFDPSIIKPGLAVFAAITTAYFALTTLLSYRKLRHFPGPRLAALSELWLLTVTMKGNLYLAVERVLRQYGSPVRVGPNMILTDDPEIYRAMTAPRSTFRRGHWYKAMRFDPRINNILSEQDEKRHAELRAKLMPGYTAKEVPTLESKIDDRVLDMINLIEKSYVSEKKPMDFAQIAQYFTLDSLTDIAFGYPFGFLKENQDLYNYVATSTAFFPVLELGTNVPFIYSILSSSLMQALAGPKPEDKNGLGALIGVAQKVVAERFHPKDDEKRDRDMLDAFIAHGLTQLEAESESSLQILAGSDSTATTIRVTLLYLLTNPPAYIRLRSEIDEALVNGGISFPVVANQEAAKLPYLQACIKEGLRIWQPLNGIVTKVAPKEGATINGVFIPGGTQVAFSKHAMMHREDVFGQDADIFRPERWLTDTDTLKAYERVWELSFSYGRFSCLGKGIALMELNKVFVELFRRFDLALMNPLKAMTTSCHQLHVQKDMNPDFHTVDIPSLFDDAKADRGMAPWNGTPYPNGFNPPTSSILAARVVNGDASSDFNQASFNQLLEESLGADEHGQPNLGSDVQVNHKLICIILKAGVDPMIRETKDNPFQSNCLTSKDSAQFSCCLDVIRTAIERSPEVIYFKSLPGDQISSSTSLPLFVWLIPKLLPLLTANAVTDNREAIIKVVTETLAADEHVLKGSQGNFVFDFIMACVSGLLDEISALESPALDTKLVTSDESFANRTWKLGICCDRIAQRLCFQSVGEILQCLSVLMGLLTKQAYSQAKRLQFRKEVLRFQELTEDTTAQESQSREVEVRHSQQSKKATDATQMLLSAIAQLNVQTPRRTESESASHEAPWPDSERARKRPKLSDLVVEDPVPETLHQQLSRRLTGAMCGSSVADLDGLSKTAPTTFKRFSEEQQCSALTLLGTTVCQLASGSTTLPECPTCTSPGLSQRQTTPTANELLRTILAIAPSMPRASKARVTAMIVLRQVLLHSPSLDDLRLGRSPAGEWCLQSMRSSSRDLRIAALGTLQVFAMDLKAEASLMRENRIIILDFLQALWSRNESALQESAVLALSRIALVVGDEELNIICLRWIEYLGHTNPYISGLVSEEIQQLAQARQLTTAILLRPFWRTLGPAIAKHLSTRSAVIDSLCALVGMQPPGLMLLIEEYSLPYLVANQKHEILRNFAAAHGGSTTVFDVCVNPRNLPAIMSHLLCQGYADPEQEIMGLLTDISDDFNSEDLSGWLAHNPIQIACSLLKSIGDLGEGKLSRTHQALQVLAQILSRKPGQHPSSTKRIDAMSIFMETNALAIVAQFTVLLNDLDLKVPKLEKKRCLAALGELVKLGKSRVIVALPQLCACLRSALTDTDLCDVAFRSWALVIGSLKEDDVGSLIDQTLAIIVQSWDRFNSVTQQHAYNLVSDMLKKHASLIGKAFETMPSLKSIPLMASFESEIEVLKQQLDDRHRLMSFIARVDDENETVAEQALTELVPLLRSKQDLLHRSILREQPDQFVVDLTRSLLDCCIQFQTNTNITGLCGQCLGSVGCLDHNKIETTTERNTILVLSNFGKAEETVDFMIFFLENVLVKAFLSASTTRAQGFLAWAMQELLQLCDEEDRSGPRIRSGPSTAHRRWSDLPEAVRTTLTPFLTSKYRVQDPRKLDKLRFPYFKPGMRHKDWLRAIVLDFLNRAPGNNVELIFGICCRIIQGQDISIAAFLLPYAILNLMTGGIQDDSNDILNEFLNILRQPIDQHDRKTQEDIKLCSQSIFEVLDYVQRWLQHRRKQYSISMSRHDRNVSDLALESASTEIKAVEQMLEKIPPDLLSRRAIDCKSYARALFHWEQYMRRSPTPDSREEDLARLQDIYAQIDEPDGIEGLSSKMNLVPIEGRVLEHKKAGRWLAAQSWYQMELSKEPESVDLQKNLMECLKESGQHDLLLDRFAGLTKQATGTLPQLTPYAVEAAWCTSRWPELSAVISSHPPQDFASHLGQVLLSLYEGRETETLSLMEDLYRTTAAELTPNAITSLQNCHETLLRLQVIDDLRVLASTSVEQKLTELDKLQKRLDVLGTNVQDKQYLLGVRRAVMQIRTEIFNSQDLASAWLISARIARKSNDSTRAFGAVLKASALGEKSAALEEAKLIWQAGQHRKAIQALEGAIDSGAFVSHNYLADDGTITLTTEQQNYQNEITAKAYVLLGKWLDHAGQTQSEVIINTFKKSTENYRRWEKGWYYLGRHYNKLLDSERTMLPEKQSQTFLSGELARLVIQNYMRSLTKGSKYVFQTLPKVLTLWFELVGGDVPQDTRRAEKFHAVLVAQRKRVVADTNAYVKKYVEQIQESILYTILPQVVARICHTDKTVYEILTTIVVKVVRAFPHQALWTLLAVAKSQSKDRASRGVSICSKVVETQKRVNKNIPPSELRNMIQAAQRFSDEVLRIADYHIEGKVTRVSLARDLGFNHKIAPSHLVVPAESCLIPSIPTSHDATYLQTFRAFAKEPVTISAFLDEALVLASLQKPRKLSIRGSDGAVYGVLAKPKDDMRKDQRLMEFNTMINRFLKRDVEATQRRLSIRTYAVIPLNEECGLIEWVNNLKTFRDIILKLYKDKSITPNYAEIRTLLDEACSGNLEKISLFSNRVLKIFPPIFHEWFIESFPDPSAWLNARLRYTRSCAVMSIVGHVLGLGDRHGENILFEEDNGSLIHVDFNCLFDKGLTFEKPEHVPFRLTHNMTDAMGVYGYEGPFRRCCEITLSLLRNNQDALMTILETFLHDPTTDFIEKERRKKKVVPGVPGSPVEVLEGVRAKVRGYLMGESVPLSVEGYVQEMIGRAVDERNLGRMYIGWCAFF